MRFHFIAVFQNDIPTKVLIGKFLYLFPFNWFDFLSPFGQPRLISEVHMTW